MLLRSFTLFILALDLLTVTAQKFLLIKTYNVDSLLQILPGQSMEERVNTLNGLAVSLSFVDFDQSTQYAGEAMSMAKELDFKEGQADAFRAFGYIYLYQGNYPMALINFNDALTLYEKLGKKHTAGWLCYDIAMTHYNARNYEKTLDYGNQALRIFRQKLKDGTPVGSVKDTLRIYEGLGLTYGTGQLGMPDKLIKCYRLSLEIGKKNNFDPTELMIITYRLGGEYLMLDNPDSALFYLNEALAYPELNSSTRAIKNRIKDWLALFYLKKGEFKKGLSYVNEAYDFYNEHGFLFWSVYLSNGLGNFYMKANDQGTAEKYFRHAETIFKEMLERDSWYRYDSLKYVVNFGSDYFYFIPPRQMKVMQWTEGKAMYYNLYQICEKKKLPYEALKYHVAYANAGDSLMALQRNRDIIELQTKYETERKEEQIKALSQENEFQDLKLKQSRGFLFGLGGLVVTVLLFAWLILRQNKLRNDQQNLLLQQKLFRSQMNPHFIFNSLTSIQNYILEENSDKASKYLSRFSKLVRNILDSSVEEYVTLQEEISTIENYLELQKLRFQNKFDYTIEVDKAIHPENVLIPPMLAQPFIENSIEHGIKHKKSKGNIFIRFTLKDNNIVFEVEDDGVGREKAREILFKQNKEHKSLATAITMERIRVLNKKLKKKIIFNLQDLKNSADKPSGTKVQLEIPWTT